MARGLCEIVGRLKYWDQQRSMTEEAVDPPWMQYLTGIIPAMESGQFADLLADVSILYCALTAIFLLSSLHSS